MHEIFSVNNELIKKYSKLKQKKFRLDFGLFLIEGAKCVQDAVLCGIEIEKIFVLKDKTKKFNYSEITVVDEKVMKKIADTESVPEILAIGKIPNKIFEKEKYKKIAIFENIKDGGNLGTIVRSACAFGIDALILTGNCIDIYNPKVVRSSVGNLFKLPVFKFELQTLEEKLKEFTLYSTIVSGGKCLEEINFAKKSAVLFGSEAEGISEKLKNFAKEHISLKMANDVESLNLAVCASIIFYKMNL